MLSLHYSSAGLCVGLGELEEELEVVVVMKCWVTDFTTRIIPFYATVNSSRSNRIDSVECRNVFAYAGKRHRKVESPRQGLFSTLRLRFRGTYRQVKRATFPCNEYKRVPVVTLFKKKLKLVDILFLWKSNMTKVKKSSIEPRVRIRIRVTLGTLRYIRL